MILGQGGNNSSTGLNGEGLLGPNEYTTLPPMQPQHGHCHMSAGNPTTVLPPSVDGYQHLYQGGFLKKPSKNMKSGHFS